MASILMGGCFQKRSTEYAYEEGHLARESRNCSFARITIGLIPER